MKPITWALIVFGVLNVAARADVQNVVLAQCEFHGLDKNCFQKCTAKITACLDLEGPATPDCKAALTVDCDGASQFAGGWRGIYVEQPRTFLIQGKLPDGRIEFPSVAITPGEDREHKRSVLQLPGQSVTGNCVMAFDSKPEDFIHE